MVDLGKGGDIGFSPKKVAEMMFWWRKTKEEKNTDLILAAFEGHTDAVKVLLEKGADANARDKKGKTALMRAADNMHINTVRALLDKGADANLKDRRGWTALMSAVVLRWGHPDTVKALLNNGADVNAKTREGNTALMYAKNNGDAKIIELLKKAGAEGAA